MNQRVLSGNLIYKGTLDGLMQTWRNEGFFALYKGFWPNWLRLGPWNIIVSFKTGLYFVYDGSGNVSKRSHTCGACTPPLDGAWEPKHLIIRFQCRSVRFSNFIHAELFLFLFQVVRRRDCFHDLTNCRRENRIVLALNNSLE